MDILKAVELRHSVRSYTDKKIDKETINELNKVIKECNESGKMNIQLCIDEPNVFNGIMAHYGKFKNVKNYIAIIGKKGEDLDERCGYYGEKVVLKATQLGLNTCWVALTYSKSKVNCIVNKDEKLRCVIALGYGETNGVEHKSKTIEELSDVKGEMPVWFKEGMKSAQLAPTAVNQQKFIIKLNENKVEAKALTAFYSKIDLGIVKYHFEIGAGNTTEWNWVK
ncbi:nitroreductase family protein [Clostridium sp. D53t1_180928_C8]|uniref:nitroreductase family protein n=1 Tax=Clostridium sp. D53t1_180928_C8 TaxID=2787101 RepID=UPI0018ABB419|nr:nitroreductase family protein [Clostridium sp. D53t1_180928_C8]